ncbi:DUF4360 domain-containing protein, partial [Actinomadura rubrisoli]
ASASASADPTAPPPGSVTVTMQDYAGSGCLRGTTMGFSVDPATHAFTFKPGAFRAQAGGTAQPTDFYRSCQVVVQISSPPEFTYAVSAADHSGFAELEPGATGSLTFGPRFIGQAENQSVTHRLTGPYSDGWLYTDIWDVSQQRFKRCDEDAPFLYLHLRLRVDLGASGGAMTNVMEMNSAEGTTVRLTWKRCP